MDELKKLEQQLVDAAKAKQEASDVSNKAEEAYLGKLNKLLESDDKFRQLRDESIRTKVAAATLKDAYAEVKSGAIEQLLELTDPEDILDIAAFGYRREKQIKYRFSDHSTIKLLAGINAFGLLKIDKKALEKYIKTNVEKHEGEYYKLPEWLDKQLQQYFGVETVVKPMISDPKIVKLASE